MSNRDSSVHQLGDYSVIFFFFKYHDLSSEFSVVNSFYKTKDGRTYATKDFSNVFN